MHTNTFFFWLVKKLLSNAYNGFFNALNIVMNFLLQSFKGRGRTMLGRNIPAYTNIMSTLLDKFSTTEDLMDHGRIMVSLKRKSVIMHQQKMENYHKSSRRHKNISKSYSRRPPARSLHHMKLRSQILD